MTANSPNGAVTAAPLPALPPAVAWKATLEELKLQMTKATYNQWFNDVRLVSAKGDHFVIGVRNQYAQDWLTSRLQDTVLRTLDAIRERKTTIEFVIKADDTRSAATGDSDASPQKAASMSYTPPSSQQDAQPGQAHISLFQSDPTRGFIAVPHYAIRFWRPFLGLVPFALWEALCSYGYFVRQTGCAWPTIESLVDTVAYGSRHTLLGRAGYTKYSGTIQEEHRAAQKGAIDALVESRIIHHWTVGSGRDVVHFFNVLESLPMLSPLQVELLSARKQLEHDEFMAHYKSYPIDIWRKTDAPTLIKDGWWK